jgi:DNA-binding NarL/FixJ family response regulator
VKFLVVDDHPLSREGTAIALRQVDEPAEVFEAERLAHATELLSRESAIDLVLLDLDLPDSSGVDTLTRLKMWCISHDIDARIVVLSGHCEPDLVRRVIEELGTGFIVKAESKAVFQRAIALTLAGGVYIPPLALKQLSGDRGSGSTPSATERTLSPREVSIAALLVQGFTYKQIARKLEQSDGKVISDHTVRAHVGNIAWKLGVTENVKCGVMAEIARRGLTFPTAQLPGSLP